MIILAVIREFMRKIDKGIIIIPDGSATATGTDGTLWPSQVVYNGKVIKTQYNSETEELELSGS